MQRVCKPACCGRVRKTLTNEQKEVNMVSNCAATVKFIDVLLTLIRPVHILFILCIFQQYLWDFPHVLQADIIWRTLLTLMVALILAVCIIKSSISPDGELQLLGISMFYCCCLSCTPINFLTGISGETWPRHDSNTCSRQCLSPRQARRWLLLPGAQ